jgi:hypothetical protein
VQGLACHEGGVIDKAVNKDSRLITADYVLRKQQRLVAMGERNRCYQDASPSIHFSISNVAQIP